MNTIILALENNLMNFLNGKPIISWVINDFLKNSDGCCTLVINKSNGDLYIFLMKLYSTNKRIKILLVNNISFDFDIFFKYFNSINKKEDNYIQDKPLSVIFANIFLLNAKYPSKNTLFVFESYPHYVGRYFFSSIKKFELSLINAFKKENINFDIILSLYGKDKFKKIIVNSRDWFDFNNIDEIRRAQKRLVESRSFNTIEKFAPIPMLIKKSIDKNKLKKEYLWYKNLSNNLSVLAPNIIDFNIEQDFAEIIMEYYGYPTLTELFIYRTKSHYFWEQVLNNLFYLIKEFKREPVDIKIADFKDNAFFMYYSKTKIRLQQLKEQKFLWKKVLDEENLIINGKKLKNFKSLEKEIHERAKLLSNSVDVSFLHGDLCFNNILYCDSANIVKLIDPRGQFGELDSNFGDIRYDISKLKHSFCGGYDHIIEGLFSIKIDKEKSVKFKIHSLSETENEKIFNQILLKNNYNSQEIDFIESLLFLSMIPLHNDSLKKQLAFYIQGIIKLNNSVKKWKI